VVRLLAALVLFGVGFAWARRRAVARFRRRLVCQGMPPEAARALSREYRDGLKLASLFRNAQGRS